ncbi:MAG: YbfB/YjiJ family MFS transporter [Burkholderiaceae bacterium]
MGMGLVAVAMSVASLWALARIDEPAPAAATASAPTGAGSLSGFVPAGVAYLLFGLGYIGYMTFIIAWLRQNGASTTDVVLMWSLLGVTTLAARSCGAGRSRAGAAAGRWPPS